MAWFKVDDKLHSHPKRYRAGMPAMGLWVIAGSWASDHLTDGFIPADMLGALGGRPAHVRALIDAGLWVEVEGGWCFHDWEGSNPTRDDVETQRADWRRRQQEARERARQRREEENVS